MVLLRNMKRFREGLVFKAHWILYHSPLGWRVMNKKKKVERFTPLVATKTMQAGINDRSKLMVSLSLSGWSRLDESQISATQPGFLDLSCAQEDDPGDVRIAA